MLSKYAGIELAMSKQQMVFNRLNRSKNASGKDSFTKYLDLVESLPQEKERFVNALTTNVSSFFREPHHFEHVRKLVCESKKLTTPFTIWSAGCSTGQEAYSILFTMLDEQPALAQQRRTLLTATDIDTQALKYAAEGKYSSAEIKGLSALHRHQFFELLGDNAWQVKEQFRRLISFGAFNLCEPSLNLPVHQADIIFCRNVMIYFSSDTQRKLVSRFAKAMQANGVLITGHAEMLLHSDSIFQSVGQTAYRKRAGYL